MRTLAQTLRVLVWLTQLGLSVAVPLVGFILLGVWLHNGCGWGCWTIPVGVGLGLLGAAGGLRSSFKTLHLLAKQDEPRPNGYNQHD